MSLGLGFLTGASSLLLGNPLFWVEPSVTHSLASGTSDPNWKAGKPQPLTHPQVPMMAPGKLALTAGKAATFLGSDGHLEVDVPTNALTASDQSAAGGSLTLLVSQIAPASGSSAGGSGHLSLGTYLLQLVDVKQQRVHDGFHAALTLKWHANADTAGIDLTQVLVVFNSALPAGTALAPAADASTLPMGSLFSQPARLESDQQTLAVTFTPLFSSLSLSWNTNSPQAVFGTPDLFNVGLNTGSLDLGYPLDLPAGPNGQVPPLTLGYSSEGVSEQHSVQGAAGWVGEGWSLAPGSISWAEHNVLAGVSGGPNWQNSWQLSDPYGTGSELIPPTITTSIYYDDTGNGLSAEPISWHTATESHAKILSFTGPVSLPGNSVHVPCFRVFLPTGIMEEFGCTADSIQYYYQLSGSNTGKAYVSSWLLDLITDRSGNQIHFTYQADMKTDTGGHSYPRDVVLSTVEWDSPNCQDTQNRCTGTNWAPLLRVNFGASHSPARLTNTPTGCNTGSNLRCDDPLDLSGSNGAAAPQVQSTFVLNDLLVQVQSGGTWKTLKDYQFSYEQSGPGTITDPTTNQAESTAGMLDLTQIRVTGAPGSAALLYSGQDTSATSSYAYLKVLDLSSQQLVVDASTTLSYWIYPQSSAADGDVSGSNSTCVALDLLFTDGTSLHDSNAVDQHGHRVHPAFQCNQLALDQWNFVTTNVGAVANGKTISHLDVGYDQAGNIGGYRGYVDDISLADSGSSTPLFATSFEGRDPQLPSNNTIDTSPGAGGITNIGGLCCGLTGPEAGGRSELAHTTGTALPPSTFTYTSQTEHYEDDAYFAPAGHRGPSWNTGCLLWSQSYAGNSRYLSAADNGMGLHQVFSWAEARNNTHGVNGGGTNALNPLYCDGKEGQGYPCSQADDQNWSHIVLTKEEDSVVRVTQDGPGGQQTSTTVKSTTSYSYKLTAFTANPCSDCSQGMYWGNQNDADYLDYYNGKFMGFAQTTVSHPDGSVDVHQYYAGIGWGIYDSSQVMCASINPCHDSPWWDFHNALHGHEYTASSYDTNGTTLLKKVTTNWTRICPPSGVSGSGSTSYGNFDTNLVSEVDHNNPVAACDMQMHQVDTYTYDGSNASGVPHQTTTYAYDSYGRQTSQTVTANDGGTTGSPTTIVTSTSYIWNDQVRAASTSATGTYLIDFPAFTATKDSSNNRYACTSTSYDGQAYALGQQSALTLGEKTTLDQYTNCGTSTNGFTPGGLSKTTWTYDQWGNPLTSTDPDANAGISGHTGCTPTGGSGTYTACTNYDTTFAAMPISNTNALNQTEQTGYTQTATGGFGLWKTSTTDINGQATTYGYDRLGRMTSRTMPGEPSGEPTTTWAYTFWCEQGGPQAPCMEVDEVQRLDDATTITTRAFYDGLGRLIELRSPGPNGQDVVHYRYYDPSGRIPFESVQYFVAAYTGAPGAAAYSIPDSTQAGTTTTYDGMGRVLTTKDAISNITTNTYTIVCGTISGDSACYEQSQTVDPLQHKQATLSDAMGREIYDQRYTGNNSSTYQVYATTKYTYDYNKNLTKILAPDGVTTTTFQFDMLNRQTGLSDPDRGTESYVYDPNGNRTQSIDARGSSGTVYTGYDGLNRQLWRSVNSNGSSPYVTYAYDSTANGNYGVGHLTSETFTNGTLSGSYSYVYDPRGQQISKTLMAGSSNYQTQTTFDDAGNTLTQTYPDGEVVTNGYTAQGWLSGVTSQLGSSTVTLLSNATYSGVAGASGVMTGADLAGGTYHYAAGYDLLLDLTDTKLTLTSDGTTLFEVARTFDADGNVTSATTTLPQGTDQQRFCYDDLNRLTWAGSVGTPPCTNTAITPGSLTTAQYTQSFAYDALNRLTNGPSGTYTYGDSHHQDAVTSIGSGYTASYDAAGNMTCRAPTNVTTCAGNTPSGSQLAYDNEGRLAHWQDIPNSPTSTVSYLYDGAGNRVAQQVTGTTTSTTVYIGNAEEVTTSGSTTTTTTYYYAGGQRIALAVNGLFSYLGTDGLGSVSVALDPIGSVQASQLFAPYGGARYSVGTMPGSYGFTGQHSDSVTGLNYANARYYDPVAGSFTSADTILAGLNRYAYVGGNPETFTDPSGHLIGVIGIGALLIVAGATLWYAVIVTAAVILLIGAVVYLTSSHTPSSVEPQVGHLDSSPEMSDAEDQATNHSGKHHYTYSQDSYDLDPVEDWDSAVNHSGKHHTPNPNPKPNPTPNPTPDQTPETAPGGAGFGGGSGGGRSSVASPDPCDDDRLEGYDKARQVARANGANAGVYSSGCSYYSGQRGPRSLPKLLLDLVKRFWSRSYSGRCAEMAFMCGLLEGDIPNQPGDTVDAYLWQYRGQPPCPTCDPVLRDIARYLKITIRIFQEGLDNFGKDPRIFP